MSNNQNSPGGQFNTTRFNAGSTPSGHVIRRVDIGTPVIPVTPPSVRLDFDTSRAPTYTTVVTSRFNGGVTGPFSIIRAANSASLYGFNFWDSNITKELTLTPLQKAQVSVMYNDFLLYNYLPVQLTPDLQQFTTVVNDTDALPPQNWGVDVVNTPSITAEDTPVPPTLPVTLAPSLCDLLTGVA